MIIKRGDAKILHVIPEEELDPVQKMVTKQIAKNMPKGKSKAAVVTEEVKEEKKNN